MTLYLAGAAQHTSMLMGAVVSLGLLVLLLLCVIVILLLVVLGVAYSKEKRPRAYAFHKLA